MPRHHKWMLAALALANVFVFVGLGAAFVTWNGETAPVRIVTATPRPTRFLAQPTPSPTFAFETLPSLAGAPPPAQPPPAASAQSQAPNLQNATARFLLGQSVQGRPINGFAFPSADPNAAALVLVSGIHGDEINAWPVLESLVSTLISQSFVQPANLSLYFVESLNPDGTANNDRLNANGVDLNRNWDTADWRTRVEVGAFEFLPKGGGPAPFSEPETLAMRDFLLNLQANHPGGVTVIYFHAAVPPVGAVLPGAHHVNGEPLADTPSRLLAEHLAEATGYRYSNVWVGNYDVTGDADSWAVAHGLRAITVELPTRLTLDPEQELKLRDGIVAVITMLAE